MAWMAEFTWAALIAIASSVVGAQEPNKRFAGNEAVRQEIQPVVRKIYDSARDPVFLLMKSGLPNVKRSRSAEVIGYAADGQLVRIVASTWVPHGKYSVEYYLRQGTLIHVYETVAFYESAAPMGAWRNFMRIPAWERRVYVNGLGDEYIETVGIGGEDVPDSTQRLSTVGRLQTLIAEKRAGSGPARPNR